jgi:hypothetical protein
MRTLHIDCGKEMAGGQWQVLYLVERLKDAVLMAPQSSPLFNEAKKRNLNVWPLSFASALASARDVDLVHAHDSRAHTVAVAATRKPLVVSRRVGFPMKRSVLSDFKYSAARRFVAVSKYAAARLVERGIDPDRIRIVYDGVPVPDQPSERTGGVVAIAKNGREALDATGIPVQIVSDLWRDLSTARVCVYLSEMEGLGSGALAAMACGVPVIASRVGGLPEIIEHERTGLLVDSPGDLEPALRRLLENADEALEMGKRAREIVRQKFSADVMTEAMQNAYEEVLD